MARERLQLRIPLEYLVIVPGGWSERLRLRISPEYPVIIVPGSWSERLQLRISPEYLVIVVPIPDNPPTVIGEMGCWGAAAACGVEAVGGRPLGPGRPRG